MVARTNPLRFFTEIELQAIEAAMADAAAPPSMGDLDRQGIAWMSPTGRQVIHLGSLRLELWRCNIGTAASVVRSLEQMRDVLDAAASPDDVFAHFTEAQR